MDPVTLGIIGLGAFLLCRAAAGGNSKFRFKRKDGEWRAYFSGSPPSHSHVLHDDDGYYVCWDRPLFTEADARQVAKRWIDTYGS
jgi:hypothetical protein